MSIERCDRCEDNVDTDKDADCYVSVWKYKARIREAACMCARCRHTHWQEIEYEETA